MPQTEYKILISKTDNYWMSLEIKQNLKVVWQKFGQS